jgi:hypothetical protein
VRTGRLQLGSLSPTIGQRCSLALIDLHTLLKSRNTMIHLDDVLRTQLDQLNRFLAIYTTSKGWIEAADYAATILLQGAACSRRLQAWAKEFIHDWSALPYHNHSNSGCGSLLDDIDFVEELLTHIADVRIHISAQAIVDFVKKPTVTGHYHILKPITLDTTREWMSKLNFKWRQAPKGMYLNGHKRPDIVHYRQNVYLPTLTQREPVIQAWDKDNLSHLINPSSPSLIHHTVLWFHDQCIFYQNDWRKYHWVHTSEKPAPLPKGKGILLMVSDFILADYGWLRSPNGTKSAVLPLFWAELETPSFANSPPFSTNRREAILSHLEHFPFSFVLRFLMFLDLLLYFMFHF